MKFIKTTEKSPQIRAVDNYGATDFYQHLTVSGAYGFVDDEFYKKLKVHEQKGPALSGFHSLLYEFNMEVFNLKTILKQETRDYIRYYVMPDSENKEASKLQTPSFIYALKCCVFPYIVRPINWVLAKLNKFIEWKALDNIAATELMLRGETVGILTHIGCARQWWFKYENNKVYMGDFANSPEDVTNWEIWEEELPSCWKYKVWKAQ